jgi:type VI secretion system protein ImpG
MMSDDGDADGGLISHLSSNYLSLSDGIKGGASMLRDMLRLYCDPQDACAGKQVEGISSIEHSPVVLRIPMPWPDRLWTRRFVSLHCDESCFAGGCAFLLASILEKLFLTACNSQ